MNNLEKRRKMAKDALPVVRKLVKQFDLASVSNAVKIIYAERAAENELRKAELAVEELKRKVRR